MGGRNKEPIALVIAKGKKHLTKEEIAARQAQEIVVPFKDDITAPAYLPEALKNEFDEIARKLKTIGIMTDLDVDALARYLLSKQQYLFYTNQVNKAIQQGNIGNCERWSAMMDKSFKQCRALASDLGLTITSRCKLAMPVVPEAPKANKFDKFKRTDK